MGEGGVRVSRQHKPPFVKGRWGGISGTYFLDNDHENYAQNPLTLVNHYLLNSLLPVVSILSRIRF